MKQEIKIRSFAKINLSLDVQGLLDNGYHKVEMVMQQIALCDDVQVCWQPDGENSRVSDLQASRSLHDAQEQLSQISIRLTTSRHDLPTDSRNLAYQAAALMCSRFGAKRSGTLTMHIEKRIPVAAGLAGGSSNCAAVLHAINKLWQLDLTITELCSLGSELGSDIPFCVMGQAAANEALQEQFTDDPLACHCALATGTGTELKPLPGLQSDLVLSKPSISVSTAEVYRGIDREQIPERPDNAQLIEALAANDLKRIRKNMVNVLENFTLKRYPIIVYTKNKMQTICKSDGVLMSGSGPTVFGLCDSMQQAKDVCREMLKENRESYWTRTTF